MTSWLDVPYDLLFILAQRLVGVVNYVRFGTVCRSWYSVVSANEQIVASFINMPWLLLPEDEESDIREFFDLSTNEIYVLSLPLLRGRRCIGSSHGWLITVGKDSNFHLLNPLTGIQIALPSFSSFHFFQNHPKTFFELFTPTKIRDTFIYKAVLSSDPANGEYVVMATHNSYRSAGLSFCGSEYEGWTSFESVRNREISFVNGKFYTVSILGKVYSCDYTTSQPKLVQIAFLPKLGNQYYNYYFVECGGELLVIARFIDHKFWLTKSHRTTDCRVFRLLDLEGNNLPANDVNSEACWGVVEVQNIGNHTLFLGTNNSVCLSIPPHLKICQPNCIYLTEDYLHGINKTVYSRGIYKGIYSGGDDSVVFNMGDFSVLNYFPGVMKPSFSPSIWITPNPKMH